ncbi:hypothetical protein ABIB57_005348 [Devosia sp. UYZn731]
MNSVLERAAHSYPNLRVSWPGSGRLCHYHQHMGSHIQNPSDRGALRDFERCAGWTDNCEGSWTARLGEGRRARLGRPGALRRGGVGPDADAMGRGIAGPCHGEDWRRLAGNGRLYPIRDHLVRIKCRYDVTKILGHGQLKTQRGTVSRRGPGPLANHRQPNLSVGRTSDRTPMLSQSGLW